MHKVILYLIVLFSLQATAQESFVPGQLLVQFKSGTIPEQIIPILQNTDWIKHEEVLSTQFNIHLLSCEPGRENIVIRQVRTNPEVIAAQLNHTVELRNKTPDDPLFMYQWALKNTGQEDGKPGADISACAAWEISTGGFNAAGDEIVVAVIDEGFQLDHPDLKDVFWFNRGEIPGNGIDDDQNGYIDDVYGWNAYNNTGNIPLSSHGTHVAGIIGAQGNNGTGVSGVNWKIRILPVAGSSENEARVVAAYSYVAAVRAQYNASNGRRGAFVVASNASFGVNQGKPADFPIWCALYDSLGQLGILNIGATTNSNVNVDLNGDIPTSCPSLYMIGVTNSTRTDEKNQSAGFGTANIDIAAPGTAIYSTNGGSAYGYRTGTSMASPMVAGAVGLMHAVACEEFTEDYRRNPAEGALKMRNTLLNEADMLDALKIYVEKGRRLNLEKPLRSLNDMPCNPFIHPRAAFTASNNIICPGDNVLFFNRSSRSSERLLWEFPGGTPAGFTGENPSVQYNIPGNYPVKLIAIRAGVSDTVLAENWIEVRSDSLCKQAENVQVNASFYILSETICEGESLQLINTSSNANYFNWEIGETTLSESVNPNIAIEHDMHLPVRLIAGNGEQRDTTDTVLVIQVKPLREKPVISLLGNKLYTLSTGPLQWNRNGIPLEGAVGNYFIPNQPGYYTVTLSNLWGCKNTSEPWIYGITKIPTTDEPDEAFQVGPVPCTDKLWLFPPAKQNFTVRLLDLLGKAYYQSSGNGETPMSITLGDLSTGIYIVEIQLKGAFRQQYFRIIKQ